MFYQVKKLFRLVDLDLFITIPVLSTYTLIWKIKPFKVFSVIDIIFRYIVEIKLY